jgi:hypothetical protein
MQPSIVATLEESSLLATNGWRGSGVHEGFKKPTDNSTWYTAFVTACKAAESAYEREVTASGPNRVGTIYFIKPVVVVDAILVAAELDKDAELLLTEIDNAAFSFEYQSQAYGRSRYQLDLVTLAGLPEYLDLIERQIEKMTIEE